MLAFLSYSHIDKSIAAWVKVNFSLLGIDAFMAHDDIEPTSEWQVEIVKQLDICDLFIPILTENFNSSDWTGQETGYAVCRGIPVIPLSSGGMPRAFISKYQAYTLDIKDPTGFGRKMIEILSRNPTTRKKLAGLLVEVFGNSGSFDQAGINMSRLLKCETYLTQRQKDRIIDFAISNPQIRHSGSALRNLRAFLDEFGDKLKDSFAEDLEEMMSR